MDKRLQIKGEQRDQLVTEIKQYFLTERDEEIGDLAAGLLLDFFGEKMGPFLYNNGLRDATAYIRDKLEDLPGLEIWR